MSSDSYLTSIFFSCTTLNQSCISSDSLRVASANPNMQVSHAHLPSTTLPLLHLRLLLFYFKILHVQIGGVSRCITIIFPCENVSQENYFGISVVGKMKEHKETLRPGWGCRGTQLCYGPKLTKESCYIDKFWNITIFHSQIT